MRQSKASAMRLASESCLVTRSKRGGPREFDEDETLSAALFFFWIRGFDGTSIAELSRR
jgi:hypothetical protein